MSESISILTYTLKKTINIQIGAIVIWMIFVMIFSNMLFHVAGQRDSNFKRRDDALLSTFS
jgi:hypothetical protein